MPLIVSVFRCNLGDCTNKGISSKHNDLCLLNVEGPFHPKEGDTNCAILIRGHGPMSAIIKPVESFELDANGKVIRYVPCRRWTMFGGNFAHTSDSRFGEAYSQLTRTSHATLAIPIHDRIEN